MAHYPVRFALAGAATLALLLSGCAGLPGYPAATGTPVAQLVTDVDCQAPNLNFNWMVFPEGTSTQTDLTATHPDAPEPGRVPADFEPVSAYLCTFYGSVDDDQGRWAAVTVETRNGDFGPLLSALAEPSDQAGLNQACTADMELVPELWLENATGDAMRAAWPRTACGKTKRATSTALDQLELTDTVKLPLVLEVTRPALDAGCVMSTGTPEQSLLFGVTGLQTYTTGEVGENPQPIPVPPAEVPSYDGVDGASVCFYTVDPVTESEPRELRDIEGTEFSDEALDSMLTLRSGTFESATTLEADAAALLPAAASAPQAPACTADLTRFAVLWPGRAGTRLASPIQVELDGCQRLFVPASEARVPAPALLAALIG
ncbi:hypothetical protein E3T39_06385 [Cryobacterium suzukii]|uniref:DUF3558 domain-containing protein n=1 Tax=Cryobacterium suzukii TaxID=1259198 RepID=A0A4R9AHG1_9MICO|nr:hypothetical protein [Cryobacterium suzukii]TFD61660.1 hypothetical protein E3T39_06385 [Cryobacterium suzukii]